MTDQARRGQTSAQLGGSVARGEPSSRGKRDSQRGRIRMRLRRTLGRTGLTVSTLCFGTGYLEGPVAAGARLLTRAYDLGVTFWDTSDDYGTHPHVARALREVGRDDIVVATKTYATTGLGARRFLTRALRELDVERVDILLLHAVDSVEDLEAKQPALAALARARDEGLVAAVGVSSHSRVVLRRLLTLAEVDVALVIVNQTGAWMKDASPAEMTLAIRGLYRSGRGVYGMKALGSGQVSGKAEVASALRYAFRFPYAHSICLGLTSDAELRSAVATWRHAGGRTTRSQS